MQIDLLIAILFGGFIGWNIDNIVQWIKDYHSVENTPDDKKSNERNDG